MRGGAASPPKGGDHNRRKKKVGQKTGLTARIRSHISKVEGPFCGQVVAKKLGIPTMKFHWAVWAMCRRGELVRCGRGWYEYAPTVLHNRTAPARRRLHKAMHVKMRFTAREIAMLAGSNLVLARRVTARLRKAGGIEAIGRQKNSNGKWEAVYRVKNGDEFFLKYVKEGDKRDLP